MSDITAYKVCLSSGLHHINCYSQSKLVRKKDDADVRRYIDYTINGVKSKLECK